METQRVIRQEKPQNEAAQESKILGKGDGQTEVLLSSDELNEIFNEWNLVNRGNLSINRGICEKLQAYIEHQKKLKTLKQELAMQLLEKYIIPEEMCDTKNKNGYDIYVNGKHITFASVFFHAHGGSGRSIITLNHFKYICSYIGNNIIPYIDSIQNNIYIDVRLWVIERNGKIDIDEREVKITIPT